MATRVPRLPGFRFETPRLPGPPVLPRMDIAVFVGFAASGPLHLPVPVDDPASFANIFGRDLELVQKDERGEAVYAHLGPVVRSFFRNGGRRCWIIRVASSAATTNRFPLAGMIAFNPVSHAWSQAHAEARSEGSWSDAIRVGTALLMDAVHVTGITQTNSGLSLTVTSPTNLQVGDLLRVTFPAVGLVVMLPVEAANVGGVSSTRPVWFTTRSPLTVAGPVTAAWFTGDLQPLQLPAVACSALPSGQIALELNMHVREAPPTGGLIRHDVAARTGWMTVDDVAPAPANPEHAILRGHSLWWLPTTPSSLPGTAGAIASRLSFQLRMRADPLVLDNLAFGQGHPRFWGDLPSDAELHAPEASLTELWQQATTPRFPLSGPANTDTLVFLPIGMLDDPEVLGFKGPPAVGQTPLERDGLAVFGPDLFLDHDLKDAGVESLAERAAYLKYEAPLPRALTGIHASIGLGEPVLIAVPDAVHAGWHQESFTPPPSPPPPAPRPPAPQPCQPPLAPAGTPGLFSDCGMPVALGPHDGPLLEVVGGLTTAWRVNTSFDQTTLREVHAGLLTMCAASADLFAVLSLPTEFREDDALSHTAWLRSLNGDADRTLSFGAVYHPWLIETDEAAPGVLHQIPPDGAVCGVMAQRALQRGAWVAPANEAFQGVVALTPALKVSRRLDLQEGRVNVVRQEPGGFMVLCADTLSADETVRPINVRRLLMLLRRLVEAEGATYVFEPNDTGFQRTVQRGFESVLDNLYRRGALAGPTATSAYQVDAGPVLNTPQSVDSGRFVVELKVAPSRPLTFITIRLVQAGDGLRAVLERTA